MRSGTILITHPHGAEQALPLDRGRLRIGSAPDNDLIMSEPEIAPHHAVIACDERGRLTIEIEDTVGQGKMHLTFDLPQLSRRCTLAWIGDYALSYQPTTWNGQTQPSSRIRLVPGTSGGVPAGLPTSYPGNDLIDLLQTMLNRSFEWPA
jgi:hypothetical protein